MTHSTTNAAARELLASALDECGRPTDAAEVREGRNPFVRGEYALAAIEKAIAIPLDAQDGLPLKVFSGGSWRYGETGQEFSASDLDEAAYAVYRPHLTTLTPQQGGEQEADALDELEEVGAAALYAHLRPDSDVKWEDLNDYEADKIRDEARAVITALRKKP